MTIPINCISIIRVVLQGKWVTQLDALHCLYEKFLLFLVEYLSDIRSSVMSGLWGATTSIRTRRRNNLQVLYDFANLSDFRMNDSNGCCNFLLQKTQGC